MTFTCNQGVETTVKGKSKRILTICSSKKKRNTTAKFSVHFKFEVSFTTVKF
jgi:hypothetical protein